jgi:Flp pilus assembly protein TadG
MVTQMNFLAPAIRRFRSDKRGVSAVEFALILPVMLLLYAGTVEISEALSVDRKVNQLSATVGDLVAQRMTMNTTEINNIFDAATAIMEPYDTSEVAILVMTVDIAANGGQTVGWARAKYDTAPSAGSASPIVIPEEVAVPETQVVVARVRYEFESPFSGFMSSITGQTSYSLEHVFMLRPRLGGGIAWES